MRAFSHPTVVLGLDAFGRAVAARVRRSVGGLGSAGAHDAHPLLRVVDTSPDRVAAVFEETLRDLLRAGHVARELTERRLDVLVVADAMAGRDDAIATAVAAAAQVVGHTFAAVFPPDRPPEQRNASLHLLIKMPAMGPTAEAAKATSRLDRVDRAALAYPLWARAWLLSEQTTAGVVSPDSLVASCAAFVVATCGAGLRQSTDPIARRLGHLPDGLPKFAFLSVAALDLPAGRLQRYAIDRAAYDGLRTLVTRVERPADRSAEDSVAMTALDVDGLLSPFIEGPVAVQVRRSAARLSGAESDRRAPLSVGAYDRPSVIRARYAYLFEPATVVREPTRQDRAILDDVLRALDRAEWRAAEEVRAAVVNLFDTTLGQATGLRRLPEVEIGLRHVVAALADQESDDLSAAAAPSDVDPDPGRDTLEAAVDALPSTGMLVAASSAMGLAASLVTMVAVAWWLAPVAAPATGGPAVATVSGGAAAQGVDWVRLGPWFAAPPAFLVAALAWSWVVGRLTRDTVVRALTDRRDAVAALQAQGGGGTPGRQAEAQLLLRRRRVRRAATVTVQRAQAHLDVARRTLLEARDAFRQRLVDQRVDPGEDAAADDLRGVLGPSDDLFQHIVPAATVSAWVSRCRSIADADIWANRLLDETWPAAGLSGDVPCGDVATLEDLAAAQVRPLREQALFANPDAAAAARDTVQAFVARASAALAPPCHPRDPHGDVPLGLRRGEVLCVAPLSGRDALGDVLRDAPHPVEALWTDQPAARVVFLRTWEGVNLEDIARGAGLIQSQVPRD